MMEYLAWRVLSGLNKKIEISFMIVGHTKFAPDWCFGLLKQKFRKSNVGCLDDLLRVVNNSATCNIGQLVGLEDGTTIIKQYDWAGYFGTFFRRAAFSGIKKWHHLVFSAETRGEGKVREHCYSAEKTRTLLRNEYKDWKPRPEDLPPEIPPPGLSLERRTYLYEKIRDHLHFTHPPVQAGIE